MFYSLHGNDKNDDVIKILMETDKCIIISFDQAFFVFIELRQPWSLLTIYFHTGIYILTRAF